MGNFGNEASDFFVGLLNTLTSHQQQVTKDKQAEKVQLGKEKRAKQATIEKEGRGVQRDIDKEQRVATEKAGVKAQEGRDFAAYLGLPGTAQHAPVPATSATPTTPAKPEQKFGLFGLGLDPTEELPGPEPSRGLEELEAFATGQALGVPKPTVSPRSVPKDARKEAQKRYGDQGIAQVLTPAEQLKHDEALKIEQDVNLFVDAVIAGRTPPKIPGKHAKISLAIHGEFEKRGFNFTKYVREWTAIQRYIQTANSPAFARMYQASNALEGSVEQARRKMATWIAATGQPSGILVFNRAKLYVYKNYKGTDPGGVAASDLVSHLDDMIAQLGIVYNSGGGLQDEILKQARRSIQADWSEEQFMQALDLMEENIAIRVNAIRSFVPIGVEEGSVLWPSPPEGNNDLPVMPGDLTLEQQNAWLDKNVEKPGAFLGSDGIRYTR